MGALAHRHGWAAARIVDSLDRRTRRVVHGRANTEAKMKTPDMPSIDELKGKWKQQVGAAKVAWGKLTEDELLRAEGHVEKLTGLVQERYAVTRDEAERQVRAFMKANRG
jgi:uncharacterized protein YjbJ (UPF0337 family)